MTLKSKLKTIFELSVFRLCHMLNLISIGAITGGGLQCAPRLLGARKGPGLSGRVNPISTGLHKSLVPLGGVIHPSPCFFQLFGSVEQ